MPICLGSALASCFCQWLSGASSSSFGTPDVNAIRGFTVNRSEDAKVQSISSDPTVLYRIVTVSDRET